MDRKWGLSEVKEERVFMTVRESWSESKGKVDEGLYKACEKILLSLRWRYILKINLRSSFSFNDHSTRFGLELYSLMSLCFLFSQSVLGHKKSVILIQFNITLIIHLYTINYISGSVSEFSACRCCCTITI